MKRNKVFIVIGLFVLTVFGGLYAKRKFNSLQYTPENTNKQVKELQESGYIKNGDLIFQTSLSEQSKAIQLATHSEYSHCGIIYKEGNNYLVFEAVQPVKKTPLNNWIARGKDGHFVIKRLKNTEKVLTEETLMKMKQVSDSFKGKDYDIFFDWSDEKIYCSELIWKVYQRATGLEIGNLEKLRQFDLSNEVVSAKIKERYGDKIPLDETVISPASIFNSKLLSTVKSN